MKKQKLSKHDEEFLVFDVLTVPTESFSNLPPRHQEWIERSVGRLRDRGAAITVDEYAAAHPVYGFVAGFAAATLRQIGREVYLTRYGFDVVGEYGALDYANETLAGHRGVTVGYHSGGYLPRMLLARLLTAGIKPAFNAERLMAQHVDLADTVTLGGMFAPPPLALTLEAMGGRCDRTRLDVAAAKSAVDRGDDDVLAEELRARIDTITRLFARVWIAPDACVNGSLQERQVCNPPPEFRRAS